jgi:hypothetical protein
LTAVVVRNATTVVGFAIVVVVATVSTIALLSRIANGTNVGAQMGSASMVAAVLYAVLIRRMVGFLTNHRGAERLVVARNMRQYVNGESTPRDARVIRRFDRGWLPFVNIVRVKMLNVGHVVIILFGMCREDSAQVHKKSRVVIPESGESSVVVMIFAASGAWMIESWGLGGADVGTKKTNIHIVDYEL